MSARFITGAALGLALAAAGFATAASAQSYTAPAGIPAAVAPGGLEGRAVLPNLYDAQRRGDRAPVIVDDGFSTGSVRGARGGQGGYNR